MKVIFVNEDENPFAEWIVDGFKTVETRNKRMLSALVGERVAIASTMKNSKPVILGYVDVKAERWCAIEYMREETRIPENSKYNAHFKWCYFLKNPERCYPYIVPTDAVRHGRSWCEF